LVSPISSAASRALSSVRPTLPLTWLTTIPTRTRTHLLRAGSTAFRFVFGITRLHRSDMNISSLCRPDPRHSRTPPIPKRPPALARQFTQMQVSAFHLISGSRVYTSALALRHTYQQVFHAHRCVDPGRLYPTRGRSSTVRTRASTGTTTTGSIHTGRAGPISSGSAGPRPTAATSQPPTGCPASPGGTNSPGGTTTRPQVRPTPNHLFRFRD